jgi:hypothetical protein
MHWEMKGSVSLPPLLLRRTHRRRKIPAQTRKQRAPGKGTKPTATGPPAFRPGSHRGRPAPREGAGTAGTVRGGNNSSSKDGRAERGPMLTGRIRKQAGSDPCRQLPPPAQGFHAGGRRTAPGPRAGPDLLRPRSARSFVPADFREAAAGAARPMGGAAASARDGGAQARLGGPERGPRNRVGRGPGAGGGGRSGARRGGLPQGRSARAQLRRAGEAQLWEEARMVALSWKQLPALESLGTRQASRVVGPVLDCPAGKRPAAGSLVWAKCRPATS